MASSSSLITLGFGSGIGSASGILTLGFIGGTSDTIPSYLEYEYFFPTQLIIKTNIIVFKTDSNEVKSTTKNSAAWKKEICTIRYRVRDSSLSGFYNFLIGKLNTTFILNHAGIQPFLRASTNNNVKILDISTPVKSEDRALFWELNVPYLFVSEV